MVNVCVLEIFKEFLVFSVCSLCKDCDFWKTAHFKFQSFSNDFQDNKNNYQLYY